MQGRNLCLEVVAITINRCRADILQVNISPLVYSRNLRTIVSIIFA